MIIGVPSEEGLHDREIEIRLTVGTYQVIAGGEPASRVLGVSNIDYSGASDRFSTPDQKQSQRGIGAIGVLE